MPVFLFWRYPDNVARIDFFNGSAPALDAPASKSNDQCLPIRVAVPGSASTRLECDARATHTPCPRIDVEVTAELRVLGLWLLECSEVLFHISLRAQQSLLLRSYARRMHDSPSIPRLLVRELADHQAAHALPIIRRNWDIDDRCALVQSPDFLRIRSLVVCRAGKGLIVSYMEPGHRGLVIEDCIAHQIEGLYRFNSHGIPEWRGRNGAAGDGLSISCGIAIAGARASDLVLRDCEMFQCSSGYFVSGSDAVVDRVYCHDDCVHNTSPHPFLVSVHRAVLRNSVFDASGWHASAGTMGIMLGDTHGLVIRNCVFRNQPDSGSHDEGGIDFENSGNGCLIDHCTFENNAGAAIEVLGLAAPQTTNVEIRDSRFIKNNTAQKLGPSEALAQAPPECLDDRGTQRSHCRQDHGATSTPNSVQPE